MTTLRRVTRALSISEEYPVAQANRLASRFRLQPPIEAYDFPEKGNINQHTYLLTGGHAGQGREYLLQRINQQVFTRPRSVMHAMVACINAQRECLVRTRLREDEEWETITLVPTRADEPFLEVTDHRGYGCWRLMVKIPDARTFKSLGEIRDPDERLHIAAQAAGGLSLFGYLTSGMDISGLENPLPGYRDTRLYYNQFFSVLEGNRDLEQAARWLPADPLVRQSTEQHFLLHLPDGEYRRRMGDPDLQRFLGLVRHEEAFGMTLLRGMESGVIRTVAIHGDTKLDNFLFNARTRRVKALVDLDTIMPHTWLADWGDMVRSLVNVAGEKERHLDKVQVDMGVYRAVARGFLRSARNLRAAEVDRMPDAVEIIALELGLRFLMDHLRGDSYFRLGAADAPDLNKTRAMAQLTLFDRLRAKSCETRRCIEDLKSEFGVGTAPGDGR